MPLTSPNLYAEKKIICNESCLTLSSRFFAIWIYREFQSVVDIKLALIILAKSWSVTGTRNRSHFVTAFKLLLSFKHQDHWNSFLIIFIQHHWWYKGTISWHYNGVFYHFTNVIIYYLFLYLILCILFAGHRRSTILVNVISSEVSNPRFIWKNPIVLIKTFLKLSVLYFNNTSPLYISRNEWSPTLWLLSLPLTLKYQNLYLYTSYNQHQLYNVHLNLQLHEIGTQF